MLPLLLLLVGAVLGNDLVSQAEQRDGYAAMGALLGLAIGFVSSQVDIHLAKPRVASSLV